MTRDNGQAPDALSLKPVRGYPRLLKILTEIFISLFGIGLVALACILIRLTHGPVNLTFLNDEVTTALNSSSMGVQAKIEGTQLAWREWKHPLEIQVRGLQLLTPQGKELVDIPEVGVSLSFFKLLQGEISLKKIRIYAPRMILRREENGSFDFEMSKNNHTSQLSFEDFLGFLMIDPENETLGSLNALVKISILGAQLDIMNADGSQNFSFPKLDLILDRRHTGFEADFKIYSPSKSGQIDLSLTHKKDSERADAHVVFSEASLGKMFSNLAGVENEFDHLISHLSTLMIPLSGEAHLAIHPQTHEIIEGSTNITIHQGAWSSLLEGDLSLGMKSGQIALDVTPQSISIKNFGLYSGDTLINIQGQLTSSQDVLRLSNMTPLNTKFSLKATLEDLPLDDLSHYWPSFLAPSAREWIVAHMKNGLIETGSLDIQGTFEKEGYRHEKLVGTLTSKKGTLTYLEGLPPATDMTVAATFNEKGFDINVEDGHVGKAVLKKGHVQISGLDNDQEAIDIHLDLESPLSEVLKIIDHKPLQYTQKAGLDPKRTSGDVAGHLSFAFPLLADLTFDDVKMNLEGTIQDGSLETEIGRSKFPINLQKAQLKVALTEKGMQISGPGEANGLPASLLWQENFEDNPQKPWQTQMRVTVQATAEDLKRFDHDYTEFVTGPTPFELTYTKTSDADTKIDFDFDLKPSTVVIPHVGWNKVPGEPGNLKLSLGLVNGELRQLQHIKLSSTYLQAEGNADFDRHGNWQDLKLSRIQFPKTDAALTVIRPHHGGYLLKASGKEMNAEPFMTYLDESEKKDRATATPLRIQAALEAIHMGEGKTFKDVRATLDLLLEKKDTIWNAVDLKAAAGKGKIGDGGIWMQITPAKEGLQHLIVKANDAGQFFRNLNIFDDLIEGELTIHASRNVGNPFAGTFNIQTFEVKKIPILARFAAVASPMGMINLFSDGVLYLEKFDANFVYGDEIVQVKRGSGKSLSIGFSVQGTIDRIQKTYNFKGAIAPLYVINSIFDNIPFIGPALNGGDGEGLFAANYMVTGPTDDPQVNINPLSALVPSFIKNIFKGLEE